MEKILKFLSDCQIFYLATIDGDLPRVRPIGFVMEHNNRLYIGLGKHKAAYKQLVKNPNLEICTANQKGEWLRIKGTAAFDESTQALAKAYETMPELKELYNAKTGFSLGLIYITNGLAEFSDMKGNYQSMLF